MPITPEGQNGTPTVSSSPGGQVEQPLHGDLATGVHGTRERFGTITPDEKDPYADFEELDLTGAEVVLDPGQTLEIAGVQVGTPEALAAAKRARESSGAPTVAGKVPLGKNDKVVIGANGNPVIKKVN